MEWNLTPHMFSHMTMNWRGNPLRTYRTVVELIGNTGMRTDYVCLQALMSAYMKHAGKYRMRN
ncbi:MAG: ISAzo13-like element transposase-related protein [Thermoplasmataceae archaeon]